MSVTDNAGRLTWKLSNFVCKGDRSSYQAPTSFMATAMSGAPVFLTTVTLSTVAVLGAYAGDYSLAALDQNRNADRTFVTAMRRSVPIFGRRAGGK